MKRPRLVGVAGGSGSGKTTICEALRARVNDCQLVSTDNYYRSLDHLSRPQRDAVNFDHPDALDVDLLTRHLQQLKQGNTVAIPTYCFERHLRIEVTTKMGPSRWILVEGILILALPTVRELLDLCVFVDAAEPTRFRRRLARDVSDRGRAQASVQRQWQSSVQAMHQQFVEPSRTHAEITVSTEPRVSEDAVPLVLQRMRLLE